MMIPFDQAIMPEKKTFDPLPEGTYIGEILEAGAFEHHDKPFLYYVKFKVKITENKFANRYVWPTWFYHNVKNLTTLPEKENENLRKRLGIIRTNLEKAGIRPLRPMTQEQFYTELQRLIGNIIEFYLKPNENNPKYPKIFVNKCLQQGNPSVATLIEEDVSDVPF